jgi:hypothetical protein
LCVVVGGFSGRLWEMEWRDVDAVALRGLGRQVRLCASGQPQWQGWNLGSSALA